MSDDWLGHIAPRGAVFGHGVEYDQQFAHARDERYLLRLAGCQQPSVEVSDSKVVAGGYQPSHVEDGPHPRASAPDGAFAPQTRAAGSTFEWEFALPMPVNSAYQSKPSEATSPESATPKPAPQSKTDNPSGAKAKATQEAKRQGRQEYDGQRNQTPERRQYRRLLAQDAGERPRSSAYAKAALTPPDRARPAAPPAPRNTGSPAGRLRSELPKKETGHPDRPESSDNPPDPGPGPILPSRNRGKPGRLSRLRTRK